MKAGTRIDHLFSRLKQEGRTGLAMFITAGDPDIKEGIKIIDALVEAGADLVEIGLPFSDPVADGPAIQAASSRALARGIKKSDMLALLAATRQRHPDLPLVVMGYATMMVESPDNPAPYGGAEKFAKDLAKAGADGVIAVDMPFEESQTFAKALNEAGLALIPLAAPTTSQARLAKIACAGQGFLYSIAILGITGSKAIAVEAAKEQLARLRAVVDLPLGIGFGIRSAEDARALAGAADLVVVGSALVEAIARAHAKGEDVAQAAADFTRPLAAALKTGGKESP